MPGVFLGVSFVSIARYGACTLNRGLAQKHTNLVGLRVETNLALLWMLSWEISVKQQQQNTWQKDSKYSTIKQYLTQ